jgi:outer membrane receptor protein involved in Fe transport
MSLGESVRRIGVEPSLAYLDAKFTTFFIPPGFNTPSGLPSTANNGNYLRNAPEWSGNLLLRYTHPLSNGASLSAQADTRYKDKVYSDPANLEFAALPSYSLTDFRLAYVKDNVEIAAVLSNAFDENYLVHDYPSLGTGLSVAGAPRMAALTVTVRK